jgi:nicotinamide-nucleotide amidase
MIPKSDHVIYNWAGTAPGLVLEKEDTTFFFMPGVPVEMKAMIESFILKHLAGKLNLPPLLTQLLRTTGIAESTLYERVEDLLEKHPQYSVAFLPRQIGVDLRFRSISDNETESDKFEDYVNEIHSLIRKFVFTTEELEMEEYLGNLLREKKLTISTAESFTGGMLNDLLTNIAGSSDYFIGGCITYSNDSKVQFLDVNEKTLDKHGAVSRQTAWEMVQGIKKKFNTDCAIATTGIAGPGGGTEEKPVGLSYIAAAYQDQVSVKKFLFGGNRIINKRRGAMAGMEMLRRLMLGIK